MELRIPINRKSLYFNIFNDNLKGHTATVSTPIKQGRAVSEIVSTLKKIPSGLTQYSKDNLTLKIVSKGDTKVNIPQIFVFNRFSVNGVVISADKSFCIYVREEIDPRNVHYGRQKLHYPLSLSYEDQYIQIDNKCIIKKISEAVHDYAFIVDSFRYNTDTENFDFDVIIVGNNGVPYSKVFLNKRGTGNKLVTAFNEISDSYDFEIMSLRDSLGHDSIGPNNYYDVQIGIKKKAIGIVMNELIESGASSVRCVSDEYSNCLYDIEYYRKSVKYFAIVRYTATNVLYFNLSSRKIRFLNDFKENVLIAHVSDIINTGCLQWIDSKELENMKRSVNSVMFKE